MNRLLHRRSGTAAAFFALFLCLACAAASSGGNSPASPRGGRPQTGLEVKALIIEKRAGGRVTVEAEIARTEEQRTTGLMFRTELPPGRGMLFVFDHDETLSFWMKNTLIPLSIAYIAYDGTITDIRDMRPGELRPVRSSRAVRYALEVPQGWFAGEGMSAGDRLALNFD